MILTAGFGEGHNTAARNLEAALHHLGGDAAQVEVADLFTVYGGLNDFARRAYLTAINKLPWLWRGIYALLNQGASVSSRWNWLGRLQQALQAKLAANPPDVVLSTHPAYAMAIGRLRRFGKTAPFSFATVITDSISINSIWYQAPSDFYLVPNEETAAVLREAGIAAEKIRAFGFPVQLAFTRPQEAPPLPDLAAGGRPRILYMMNSGRKMAPELVAALLKRPEWDLTLAVGREETLLRQMTELTAGAGERVRVLGWTNEMPRLLMSHHILLAKAGGATVQEAIAARCPMLMSQVVPGQEWGNYELLRRHQAGVLAREPQELVAWLDRLFAEKGRLWELWRENIGRLSKPESALESARFILELAGRER